MLVMAGSVTECPACTDWAPTVSTATTGTRAGGRHKPPPGQRGFNVQGHGPVMGKSWGVISN